MKKCNISSKSARFSRIMSKLLKEEAEEDYFFSGVSGVFARFLFAVAGGMYWTTSL